MAFVFHHITDAMEFLIALMVQMKLDAVSIHFISLVSYDFQHGLFATY